MDSYLRRLLELLAQWVIIYTKDREYTGQVIFNFNQGKPNEKAIYLKMRTKI